MGLTVTNTNTMNLLGILGRTEKSQSNVLTQLSTGLKINKGADNPAGLIALKSLEAEITAVDASLQNNQRTDAFLGVADAALGEIHSLLQEIESLVVASNSDSQLSSAEKSANQSQIDLAISSIDRIVRTTTFNGKNLLDGTGGINITNDTVGSSLQDIKVFNRGNLSSNLQIGVSITTSADSAAVRFATMSTGTTGGSNNGTAEFAITGSLGTATVALESGLTATQVAARINQSKDLTGVSAVVSGTTSIVSLVSTERGSTNFVIVDSLNDVLDLEKSGQSLSEVTKTSGTDAVGLIGGTVFTADGQKVTFNISGVSGQLTLSDTFSQDGTNTRTFTVQTTGGFTFQLGSDSSTRQTIGINALYSHNLGGTDVGGYLNELSSGGDADLTTASSRETALKVVRDAINDVAVAQGRIGGFQKFQVQPAINSLNAAKIGLSQAASVIGDTDYAVATAELNKQSVLLNSGISLLGLANQQAAQILSLLG